MSFSKEEKAILENFVTSSEDYIYAIKHNVPPEVFGAFGSYFSRNPKDFRAHLLDALRGQIDSGEDDSHNYDELRWLVEGDFRTPTDALSQGVAKSQDFFKKWYGKYSHKSIANTVWIPMVATNVSQLFARELAYDQLAFFIEQSTRYVKWGLDKMFKDPDIMNSEHKAIFINSLETSVNGYDRLTGIASEFYKQRNPFNEWLEGQSDNIKNGSEKLKQSTYDRQINGAALDVARFLLPQACMTNIAWILDARSTEFDIAAWKGHPLSEMRSSANAIEHHAGQIAPSLLKYTEENFYYSDKLCGYGETLISDSGRVGFEKGVEFISYDKDSLDKSLAHLIKRHNFGGTFRQRYNEVQKMSFDEKIGLLRRITKRRGSHDEWVAMDEDFDLTKTTFEIRTDIGATRDWRRHQKFDRGEPLYSLDNGVHKPFMVNEMGDEANKIFDNVIDTAYEAEDVIGSEFPYQAQYVIPMATMHAPTMSAGLDQLQYMLWTRTTPQGNFSYREDAFNIAEELIKTHPWMLGYENYPKGKDFMQVYEQAPLKNLLKLQTGDTALHV